MLGTADVDCLLLEGEVPACLSRGDKDLESALAAKSAPREGEMMLALPWRPSRPPPGWKGSVTARGRDRGRPKICELVSKAMISASTYLCLAGSENPDPYEIWEYQKHLA